MEALKLKFADPRQPELPLAIGMHRIGAVAGRGSPLALLAEDRQAPVNFCVDRRGVWMTVNDSSCSVHVNGRQVRRMAMLRAGDAVYVDGAELRLVSSQPPQAPSAELKDAALDGIGDCRVVLRGVGGKHHGRSFTLERPRLVGRSADADIRIEEPTFAERHARVEMAGEQVLLRDLGSAEGSVVNGEPVRDAVLQAGDQVVFDAHHRFVLEAPLRPAPGTEEDDDGVELLAAQAPAPRALKLPWLLLAALLIAGLLALLLLFGTG